MIHGIVPHHSDCQCPNCNELTPSEVHKANKFQTLEWVLPNSGPSEGNTTPSHYNESVQPVDLIRAFNLDFFRGNVVKYVSRAGRKGDELEDLLKARYYLDEAIKKAQNGIKS